MLQGRKFFKTKLCKLYQSGRCPRPNCNFAHGNGELRQTHGPAPFNGRRDFRSGDLRDKLERRYSPHRRYSPGRDGRAYHGFHGQRPVSHDRGYSNSRSPAKRRYVTCEATKDSYIDGHVLLKYRRGDCMELVTSGG